MYDDIDRALALAKVHAGLFGGEPEEVRIGRYRVVQRVGAGAAGVVYECRDDELDRAVAVKLVTIEGSSELRRHRLREAKALAKLTHPNVLTVHEVGSVGDRMFIAAEFVRGHTLSEWLRQGERDRTTILNTMIAVGRGLAAAHDAGLVHRDIKPDNIMVGDDGRVLVVDFGLARLADQQDAPPSTEALDILAAGLTAAGAVVGTPLTMAPEQHRSEGVDARSDQYAFCASLFMALYGEPPFSGKTVAELYEAKLGGLGEPPDKQVPRWLFDVLARGLAPEPDERFASMHELLATLENDPIATRKRRVRYAAVVALAMAATVVVTLAVRGTSATPACPRPTSRLDGIWDADRKQALRTAFAASKRGYAADSARRVERIVDDYTDAWLTMHSETCEATRVDGSQSERLMDLRMRCLEQRHGELAALLDVLTNAPSAATVDKAIVAVMDLTPVKSCAEVERLQEAMPLPPEPAKRERIAELTRRYDAARAKQKIGRLPEALAEAESFVDDVRASGYPPLLAKTLLLRGTLLADNGKSADAEPVLRETSRVAAEAHEDELVARAWLKLASVVGQLGNAQRSEALAEVSEALVARAPDNELLVAHRHDILASIAYYAGRFGDAERSFLRAAEHRKETIALAISLSGAAACCGEQGKYQDAQKYATRAVAIQEKLLGPDHMYVGLALENLGAVLLDVGELDEAKRILDRSIGIIDRTLGADHPLGISVKRTRGTLLQQLGEPAASRAQFERVESMIEAAHGAREPSMGLLYAEWSTLERFAGDLDRAGELSDQALTILEKARPAHPDLAGALLSAGWVAHARGEFDDAAAAFQRAVDIFSKVLGDEHLRVGEALTGLAACRLAQGKPAVDILERALPLLERGTSSKRAVAELLLAKALPASERSRARQLAQRARDAWSKRPTRFARELADADAWLTAHPL